jgi:FkbM family methyltransferase
MYFDIGSNVGKWSLENVNKCEKIISIEASPITYKKLQNNCKNEKIILLNYAVCNNNGNDITFYNANCDTLSTINKDWLVSKESRFCNQGFKEMSVKTITIDKLIELYGLPELIKVDVEGGEYECIASLSQKVNHLCFEWASELNNITLKCLDYLSTLGFTNFYIQNEDNYSFRPTEEMYYDISTAKSNLLKTKPKVDWGMLWCK